MLSMVRGQKIKLSDLTRLTPIQIGIEVAAPAHLLFNVLCIGVNEQNQWVDRRYLVFRNQKSSAFGEVVSIGCHHGELERFQVDSDRLPATVRKLVFALAVQGAGALSQLQHGCLKLSDQQRDLATFTFKGVDFTQEKAIIVGELYFKEVWRFGATGQGFNDGISALLAHFGGQTPPELLPSKPQPVPPPLPPRPQPLPPKPQPPAPRPPSPPRPALHDGLSGIFNQRIARYLLWSLGLIAAYQFLFAESSGEKLMREAHDRVCRGIPADASGIGQSPAGSARFWLPQSGIPLNLPAELKATSPEQFKLAVCITSHTAKAGECRYSYGEVLERSEISWDVAVYDVRTAKSVAQETFKGHSECPQQIRREGAGYVGTTSSPPSAEPVIAWLRSLPSPSR